jgi:type I restriction enzyme, S subunit
MRWKDKTLKQLGEVSRGKSRHRPRNAPELYGGKYPLIQTGDIEAANFYLTEYKQTYSELGLSQSKLWPKNTLCISIVGANTGASAILKFESCFPDSVIGFIPFDGISDVKFIKYSLELLRAKLKFISEGAARENLSMEKLLTVKIKTPDYPTQRRIASILSAYDDLIENNIRRIKLLEELAQRTYEEWFVKFTINGEKLPLNEETGLPEGWVRKKLGEVANLTMGQSPKSEFYNFEKDGLPFHQGVKDYGFRYPENNTWSKAGNRFAFENDILFSVRAPVGRLNIAPEKIILGRGLAAINHKIGYTSFLFYHLQKIFFKDDLIGRRSYFQFSN